MDELASIRAFVRVVETGSFAAAGRLLAVSKSVITKRINELESRLKAQLLVRSTRRLTLTDAGATYFETCTRIIDEVEAAQAAVRSRSVGLAGVLRVSCIASFTARQLSADLCKFQRDHPGLTLELHHNDRVYDPIKEGYDLCIQTSDVAGSCTVKCPITVLRRLFVATPAYLEKYGSLKHPKELIQHRVAHNNFIQPSMNISFLSDAGNVTAAIKPVVFSNSIWMIHEAVLHGDCIGILPVFFVVDELCDGRLVPVFETFRIQSAPLSGYYRQSAYLPMKVRMLLDYLVVTYKERPPWERALLSKRPDLERAVFGAACSERAPCFGGC